MWAAALAGIEPIARQTANKFSQIISNSLFIGIILCATMAPVGTGFAFVYGYQCVALKNNGVSKQKFSCFAVR